MAQGDLVLAITGASGAPYAVRLLEVLLAAGRTVHLVVSPAGAQVVADELGRQVRLDDFRLDDLLGEQGRASDAATSGEGCEAARRGRLQYHHYLDYSAGIASGSFLTAGMVVCPCSMNTLSAVATGVSTNLIHRAADVHLKERRKLILVPRETPLNVIQLENMAKCVQAGAVVLPAMPGFYTRPKEIGDLVDFVVGRVCDQLGVEHKLLRRWGE